MTGLPLPLKLGAAIVVAGVIAWGFFGRPPETRDLRITAVWLVTSGLLSLGAVVGLARDDESASSAFVAGAVIALSVAVWHARGTEQDDGGQGVRETDPEGPFDWDAFDRARRGWERPKVPT